MMGNKEADYVIKLHKELNLEIFEKTIDRTDPVFLDQYNETNLKMQVARVMYYVDKFIPPELHDRFLEVLHDYAAWHGRIIAIEMRRAVKRNAFAPADKARKEGGDAAAAISIGVALNNPDAKGKDLTRKIEEERARVLGEEHRSIDRSTIHRHLKMVGKSKRKRK